MQFVLLCYAVFFVTLVQCVSLHYSGNSNSESALSVHILAQTLELKWFILHFTDPELSAYEMVLHLRSSTKSLWGIG